MRRSKRWLIGLAAGSLAGGIAVNVLAYRHAHAMLYFSSARERTSEPERLSTLQKLRVLCCGVDLPRPYTKRLPTSLGPEGRTISVTCTNGIRLGAWYCPAKASSPLVILFHGYGGEKSGTLAEARAFLDMDCSVMLVDFRGSGESSEAYTTVGFREAEDVASTVRYAREQLPHSRIILYGHSMGAAAVLRAVHSCGVKADAVIVESVFDNMLHTVRHRFEAMKVPAFPSAELLVFWGGYQTGFNGFSHNPSEYATKVNCPILFLHGGADPRAHVEEARRVFSAVPGVKVFKEFPGNGHRASVLRFPAEWKGAVKDFLETAGQKS